MRVEKHWCFLTFLFWKLTVLTLFSFDEERFCKQRGWSCCPTSEISPSSSESLSSSSSSSPLSSLEVCGVCFYIGCEAMTYTHTVNIHMAYKQQQWPKPHRLTSLVGDTFHIPPGSSDISSPSLTVWQAASLCRTSFTTLLNYKTKANMVKSRYNYQKKQHWLTK